MKHVVIELKPFQSKSSWQIGLMALVLGLLLFLLAGTTAAHALLIESEPENAAQLQHSPQKVIAWFSQELDTGFSLIQVFDGEGRQVDNGDGGVDLYDPDHASMIVTLPDTLADGIYTVRWTAVSVEDGDDTSGEFAFSVGSSSQVTINQTTTARALSPDNQDQWSIMNQLIIAAGILAVVTVGMILLFLLNTRKKTAK